MPREQIKLLSDDVNRLLAAGGTSASGDSGLRRREGALRELGAKVPALARVADAVAQVVAAEPSRAPRALLDLLLVVAQVRASLATAGVPGALEPAAPSGPWSSGTPARDLYPVAEALGGSGSDRNEVVRGRTELQVVGDLRLFDLLLDGLDDGSPVLATAVATAALPRYGPAALPDLRRTLDLQGKAADAWRLAAIAAIDPREGSELCRRAIAEGSTPLRVRALECLAEADPEGAAAVAIELLAPGAGEAGDAPARSKRAARKPDAKVRLAALECLKPSRRDEALDILVSEALDHQSTGHRAAHDLLARLPHPATTARLLSELGRVAAEARKPPPKAPRGPAAKGKKSAAPPPNRPPSSRRPDAWRSSWAPAATAPRCPR